MDKLFIKAMTVSQEACLRCNSGMLEPMIYFITMRTREQEENTIRLCLSLGVILGLLVVV